LERVERERERESGEEQEEGARRELEWGK